MRARRGRARPAGSSPAPDLEDERLEVDLLALDRDPVGDVGTHGRALALDALEQLFALELLHTSLYRSGPLRSFAGSHRRVSSSRQSGHRSSAAFSRIVTTQSPSTPLSWRQRGQNSTAFRRSVGCPTGTDPALSCVLTRVIPPGTRPGHKCLLALNAIRNHKSPLCGEILQLTRRRRRRRASRRRFPRGPSRSR